MITAAQVFITNVHVHIDLQAEPDWPEATTEPMLRDTKHHIVQTATIPVESGFPAHDVFTFDDNSSMVIVRDSENLYRIADARDLDAATPYGPENHAWLLIGDQDNGAAVRHLLSDIADIQY